MSFLLNKELKTIKQREHDYLAQKHQVDVSLDEAKTKARHIMGNPETLAAIFTAGAFKGAETDSWRKPATFQTAGNFLAEPMASILL